MNRPTKITLAEMRDSDVPSILIYRADPPLQPLYREKSRIKRGFVQ